MKEGTLVSVRQSYVERLMSKDGLALAIDRKAVENGGYLWIVEGVSGLNNQLLMCRSLAVPDQHHFWLMYDEVDVP